MFNDLDMYSKVFVDALSKMNLNVIGTKTYRIGNTYDLISAITEHIHMLFDNTYVHESNRKWLAGKSNMTYRI